MHDEIVSSSQTNTGIGKIWLAMVGCFGDESILGRQCLHTGWDSNSCTHAEDVAIVCDSDISIGNYYYTS